MTTKQKAIIQTGTLALHVLAPFIGHTQRAVLLHNLRGEEGEFFAEKLQSLARVVATMPETYQTEGQGENALAHLHYFAGGRASWYITEKDSNPDGDGQLQAFGLADLFGDGGEVGYISISELIANGAELDLYWKPAPLLSLRHQAA